MRTDVTADRVYRAGAAEVRVRWCRRGWCYELGGRPALARPADRERLAASLADETGCRHDEAYQLLWGAR